MGGATEMMTGRMFGFEPPPHQPTLKREVLRWIQSLDLSFSVKDVRKDFSNGFLVAEVCQRYLPGQVDMHSYENAVSTHRKMDNWMQIMKLAKRHTLPIELPLVEAVVGRIPGAANQMVETLYTHFTGRALPVPTQLDPEALKAAAASGLPHRASSARRRTQATAATTPTGAKTIAKMTDVPPAVQFGAVRQLPAESAIAARQRLAHAQ